MRSLEEVLRAGGPLDDNALGGYSLHRRQADQSFPVSGITSKKSKPWMTRSVPYML